MNNPPTTHDDSTQSTTETPEHQRVRTVLASLENRMPSAPHCLPDADLYRYSVRVLPLDSEGEELARSKFFVPRTPQRLVDPDPEFVERKFDTHRLAESYHWPQQVFGYLDSYLKCLEQRWGGHTPFGFLEASDQLKAQIFNSPAPQGGPCSISYHHFRPHIKCIYWCNLEAEDNELLRYEVSALLRLHNWQMKQRICLNEMIIPTLLIALNGSRARILEAYHDGEMLVVRRTRLYSFPEGDYGSFKTLARWFLAGACGDTSMEAYQKLAKS